MNPVSSMHVCHQPSACRHQRGAVLFVALILLVILSLLGVSAARMQMTEERMARNEDNRQTAEQAAEAALRYAESLISTGIINPSTCAGNTNGQYTLGITGSIVSASGVAGVSWSALTPPAVMLYAGPALSSLPASAQTPMIVVEALPNVCTGLDVCTQNNYGSQGTSQYRITAYGQGADSTSYTILQSIYRGG